MGSSARSCGRPRLPSSGDRGRSDCPSCRSRGNACCATERRAGGSRRRRTRGLFAVRQLGDPRREAVKLRHGLVRVQSRETFDLSALLAVTQVVRRVMPSQRCVNGGCTARSNRGEPTHCRGATSTGAGTCSAACCHTRAGGPGPVAEHRCRGDEGEDTRRLAGRAEERGAGGSGCEDGRGYGGASARTECGGAEDRSGVGSECVPTIRHGQRRQAQQEGAGARTPIPPEEETQDGPTRCERSLKVVSAQFPPRQQLV
jgi:hypothetical protein